MGVMSADASIGDATRGSQNARTARKPARLARTTGRCLGEGVHSVRARSRQLWSLVVCMRSRQALRFQIHVSVHVLPESGDAPLLNFCTARSFVYGQVSLSTTASRSIPHVELKRRRSVPGRESAEKIAKPSAWTTPVGSPSPSTWIPWLSEHHRMLFNHFQEETIKIFHDWPAARLELKCLLIPMAADTNHGFSLLSAILSLGSTHRMNLGVDEDRAEIEYWRGMSIGHLRRPGVQE